MTPLRHKAFCWACYRFARGLSPHWKLAKIRFILLVRVPPRMMIIFSGFQILGWIVAILFELFDPSSFSGTVIRVREYFPAWLCMIALLPIVYGEISVGLFESNRWLKFWAICAIFWWSWLSILMLIVEPKNVAAFNVYALIAIFRAWAFASSRFPGVTIEGSDAGMAEARS